jgi:hypothetical protein
MGEVKCMVITNSFHDIGVVMCVVISGHFYVSTE